MFELLGIVGLLLAALVGGGSEIDVEPDPSEDIQGSSENDALFGTDIDSNISGEDGDDILDGRGGNDNLYGGNGQDVMHGGDGDDHLFGQQDDDTLSGEAGDDTLDGGAGNDRLLGNNGDDTLNGQDGDDQLFGGEGNDHLMGDTGNDAMQGSSGDDYLAGGLGQDTMFGGIGNDVLEGAVFDPLVQNSLDQDIRDFLNAGEGDDILRIGNFDIATGNGGNDSFVLGDWIEAGKEALIQDFDPATESITIEYRTEIAPTVTIEPHPSLGDVSYIVLNGQPLAALQGVISTDPINIIMVARGAQS